jgi:hypothetical protein
MEFNRSLATLALFPANKGQVRRKRIVEFGGAVAVYKR